MTLFLLSCYFILFYFLMRRRSFFHNSGIHIATLMTILGSKVLAGLSYAYLYKHFFMSGDTFAFYEDSLRIAYTFWDYPMYYIESLLGLPTEIPQDANIFTYPSQYNFWKDLGTYMTVHFNALLVPLCCGIYEVQIIFSAFISLCAGINTYNVLKKHLHIPNTLLLLSCFLLPSLLFWTSGLHKDVLLFFAISLALVALDNKNWTLGISAILLIGLTRHYCLLFLPIALFSYFLVSFRKGSSVFVFLFAYLLLFIIGLISIDIFILEEQILQILQNKQNAFSNELGMARIHTIVSLDSWWHIVKQAYIPLYNTLLRPFFWESNNIVHFLAGIENIFILTIFALAIIFRRKALVLNAWWYALFTFSIGFLFLVGILVVNEGTIVRYRCIPIAFLTMTAFHCTDFSKIKMLFQSKKQRMQALQNIEKQIPYSPSQKNNTNTVSH